MTTANTKSVQTLVSIEDGFLVIRVPLTVAEKVDSIAEHVPEGVRLTPRQKEMFEGLLTGRSVRQIADSIGISVGCAKFHTYQLLKRLGLRSLFDFRYAFGVKQWK